MRVPYIFGEGTSSSSSSVTSRMSLISQTAVISLLLVTLCVSLSLSSPPSSPSTTSSSSSSHLHHHQNHHNSHHVNQRLQRTRPKSSSSSSSSSLRGSRDGRSFGAHSAKECSDPLPSKKRIVCYYRVEENFRPYDLDPCLCTHVVYSYVAIKENLAFIAGKKGEC